LYDYPQAAQQPYYAPYQPHQCPPCPVCSAAKTSPAPDTQPAAVSSNPVAAVQQPAATQAAAAQASAMAQAQYATVPAPVFQPQVIQQNYNAPIMPPPIVVTPQAEAKAEATANTAGAAPKKIEVVPPEPLKPQVDLSSFIDRLNNPDFDVQASAMEEIANMVKEKPEMATELLDEKIINALTAIIKTDSAQMAGPDAAQIAVREKLISGKQLTEAEQHLAMTMTPMERAERNKVYATFTTAILQKLYADEVNKLTSTTVPLTELPGAVTIVESLKDNDNPMLRTSAIEALSYIQNPAYKQDLVTLFTVARNDADPGVREAAQIALARLEAKNPDAQA
jgi:hypothetical protein